MKRVPCLFLSFLLTTVVWAQISKDQLYEMTEKGLDESVIVSLVENNCVDFELDGQMVVELSSRVSAEVLRTVIDCVRAKEEKAESQAKAATEAATPKALASPEQAEATMQKPADLPKKDGVALATFLSVEVGSNKDSFAITDLEFRLVAPEGVRTPNKPITFKYSGSAQVGETVRCYRSPGEISVEPGEYIAYLHVVSSRERGIRNKKVLRSDLHKFRVEFTGPGPIKIEYYSTEDKVFKSPKPPTIEAHGPMSFFGEQHVSVDGRNGLENLTSLIGDASKE